MPHSLSSDCTCDEEHEPHPCPYIEGMGKHEEEDWCTCCSECEGNCSQDL